MKILMPEASTLTNGDVDLSEFDKIGDVVVLKNSSLDLLKQEISDADIILVNKTVLNKDVLSAAKQLKYIGECATGYNNIDLDYCKLKGIAVTNVPDYSTNAVAQQVFAYILNHYSKVNEYNSFVKNSGWINSDTFAPFVYSTDELFGKTIGLVGYGKIGKAVAKIANAFGMNILVYTRSYSKMMERYQNGSDRTELDGFLNHTENYVSYVTLDNLLRHSDIVSVHCPLNDDSLKMFDKQAFSKMRKGAFFINTSRGGIVDEVQLKEAIESHHLSGAALDVLCEEPMSNNCPLIGVDNCLITPHVAWSPYATRKRLVSVVLNNLKSYLNGHSVNVI